MAEKGILVQDAAGGESVACRDAIANDDNGNPRIIQIVDKARRPHAFRATDAATRTVTASDAEGDLSVLSSDLANSALLVQDETHLALRSEVSVGGTGVAADIIVTPLILDPTVADPTTDRSVLGFLEPKRILGLAPSGNNQNHLYWDDKGDMIVFSQIHVWPLFGAEKIALHTTITVNAGTVNAVMLFGRLITADHLTVVDTPQPQGNNSHWGFPQSAA